MKMTFEETGLRPELVQAVADMGFEHPTPIQEKIIPILLESDRDVVALAQTGTGKTAAFSLPLLHQIDPHAPGIQALILCPTRELCVQITRDIDDFSKHQHKMNVVAVYGGASMDQQVRAIKNGVQIVVGTPGRVHDLLTRRKVLRFDTVQYLVLDEADEMLSMGFKEELDAIVERVPEERQTLLFSATMPDAMAANFTHNPLEISVGQRNAGADTVQHLYYVVNARQRYEALRRIVDFNPDIYGIVFCRTRHETQEVATKLGTDGYDAEAIHGDLSQAQRDYVMNRFRTKQLQILVATDVAARGLDVNDLTHVINYNLPDDIEVYTHRSGRTGRAGKEGISIAIVHSRETGRIRLIEKKMKKTFVKALVPSGREICERQLFSLVGKVHDVTVDNQIDSYLPAIEKKLSELSREELIKRFVSVEFNRFLAHYENAPDLNAKVSARSEKRADRVRGERTRGGNGRGGNTQFARFNINVGSKNKLSPARLIGLINEQTRRDDVAIGKINIMPKYATFEIDREYEKKIAKSFDNVFFEGTPVLVESAGPSDNGDNSFRRSDKGNFRKKKKGKKKRA